MAAKYTVTNQRQTTQNKVGVGLVQVMEITFETPDGHVGTVDVPLSTYKNLDLVRGLIEDRVNQVNAVASL